MAKAHKGPEAHLLPVTIRINDQLCQQHYNQFVMYTRNKAKSSNKRKNNRDSGYHESGWPQKRVCLTQEKYEQLINKETTMEQLQQQIEQTKSELNDFKIASKKAQINSIVFFIFKSLIRYFKVLKVLVN